MASIDSPTSLVSNTAMISEAQKTLSLLDYGPLSPSGEFDAATGDAIQKFKVDHNILPADRTLDRKTYEAILSAYKFGKYKTALKYVGGGAALLGLGLLAKKALSRSKAELDSDNPYAKYKPLYREDYYELAGVLEPRAFFSRVKLYNDDLPPPPPGVTPLKRDEFIRLSERAYDQAFRRLEEMHAKTMQAAALAKQDVAADLRKHASPDDSFVIKNPEYGPAFPLPR